MRRRFNGPWEGTYTSEGITALAGALCVNASVTSVSVLGNKFDTETAAMLLKVKEEHPKLKTLCGFTHEETELNLSGRGLGPADAMLIAPELGAMASVSRLDARFNSNLGYEGKAILREAVKEKPGFELQL